MFIIWIWIIALFFKWCICYAYISNSYIYFFDSFESHFKANHSCQFFVKVISVLQIRWQIENFLILWRSKCYRIFSLVSLLSKCQSKKKLCRYFLTIMYIEILELKAIFFSWKSLVVLYLMNVKKSILFVWTMVSGRTHLPLYDTPTIGFP